MYAPNPPTSPGYARAPPVKKQRSSGTPPDSDTLSLEADAAIARRRAKLRRLQELRSGQQQRGPPGSSRMSTNDLLARAQKQLNPTAGPPRSNVPPQAGKTQAPPPPHSIPKPDQYARVRHSDLFPTVPKEVTDAAAQAPSNRKAPPPGPPPPAPPPEQAGVARRLEVSFAKDGPKPSRSKSAPPSRPPPPPPVPPPLVAEAPDKRSYTSRPPPVTPGAAPPPPPRVGTKKTTFAETPEDTKPAASFVPRRAQPTSFPDKDTTNAGHTPFPKKDATANAGHTPFPAKFPTTDAGHTPFPTKVPTTDAGHTPFPGAARDTSSTVRRDMLRNMSEYADTPPSKMILSPDDSQQSPELRVQKELQQASKEKSDALQKVSQLEEEIQRMREKSDSSHSIYAIVQMAENEGESAALEWARQQLGGGKHVGFLSPLASLQASPSRGPADLVSPLAITTSTPVRRRAATPYPKRETSEKEEDQKFYRQAAECVQHVYVTDVATFTVRRPYGLATERDLWFSAGELNNKMYQKSVNVKKSSTLEVAAKINADGSFLVLHGEASVRHQNASDGEWHDFGDANERGKPLGSVMYIDGEANEREYSLDEIFEGADSTRYSYCLSIISTADGLHSRELSMPTAEQGPPKQAPAPEPVVRPPLEQKPKPMMTEASVQTDALAEPKAVAKSKVQPEPKKDVPPAREAPPAEKPLPPPEESSNVMGVFASMFFSSLVSLIYTIFIGIPLRILTTTFVLIVSIVLLSLIWLYMVDDHGARAMGASIDFMYNRPGIL